MTLAVKVTMAVFSENINTNRHTPTNTGEKPFECQICHKTFALKGTLTVHMRTHTGEKPFKCDVCPKAFSLLQNLSRHMRTHTGERPFECDICDKSFSRKVNLSRHKRIHTGENPIKCHICNKSFAQKSHLNNHIRVHTGEKPFKCECCDKSFSRKVNLSKHMRTHTGEKTVQCEVPLSTKIGPRMSEEKHEKYEEEKLEDAEGTLAKEDITELSVNKEVYDKVFTVKEEKEDNDNFYELEEIELEPIVEDIMKTEKEYEEY